MTRKQNKQNNTKVGGNPVCILKFFKQYLHTHMHLIKKPNNQCKSFIDSVLEKYWKMQQRLHNPKQNI